MPNLKEPNFFALEGQTRLTGYGADDPDGFHHYPWSVTRWKEYQSLFAEATTEKAIGEASTMYLYRPGVPGRMLYYLDEQVRLIAILRHPADRLYARYLHLARENRLPRSPFQEVFNPKSLWWQKADLVPEGFYFKHLRKFFMAFPARQIKIIWYEDLAKDTEGVVRSLYEFLGVSPEYKAATHTRLNPGGHIKNQFLHQLIGGNSLLLKTLRTEAPQLYTRLKNTPHVRPFLESIRRMNLDRQPLDTGLRQKIMHQIYRDDYQCLIQLVGKPPQCWLT